MLMLPSYVTALPTGCVCPLCLLSCAALAGCSQLLERAFNRSRPISNLHPTHSAEPTSKCLRSSSVCSKMHSATAPLQARAWGLLCHRPGGHQLPCFTCPAFQGAQQARKDFIHCAMAVSILYLLLFSLLRKMKEASRGGNACPLPCLHPHKRPPLQAARSIS